MPKNLSRFAIGVRVSFLPRAFSSHNEARKFNTTKNSQDRLYGLITAIEVEGQSSIATIDVDGFGGVHAKIKVGSLKYEVRQPAAPATQQAETNDVAGLVDYDSDTSSSDSDQSDAGNEIGISNEDDLANQWKSEEVLIDARFVGQGYTHGPQLTLPGVASSSPRQMFQHFLPMQYIEQHVVPAINEKAAQLSLEYWQTLTLQEYMLWIGLWTCMALIPLNDRSEYWSTTPTFLLTSPINFSRWMNRRRFEMILRAHTLQNPAVVCDIMDIE